MRRHETVKPLHRKTLPLVTGENDEAAVVGFPKKQKKEEKKNVLLNKVLLEVIF